MPRRLKQEFAKTSLLNRWSGEGVKDYLGIPITNLTDAKLKVTVVKVRKYIIFQGRLGTRKQK